MRKIYKCETYFTNIMKSTQLLRDQKQELELEIKNKKIIKRQANNNFEDILNSKLIKVISGVRRCGKSIFSYMLLKDKNFAYINFDDERVVNIDTNQILSSFYEIYGKDLKYIFLDEIQNLENWELFVNRLHRAGFNLLITGSNAKLLSKELATHLTGRHITIELFPFSFSEYLKAINFKEDIQTSKGISLIKYELKNYLNFGGFPEIVVEKENSKIYIRELYRKIIERDIVYRYNISYKQTFREIAMSCLSNPGRKISYNKLKKQFGLGSEHTVKNYLFYLEEAYLIFLLNKYSFKPIEIQKSQKKIYAIDTGIINHLSLKFSEDYGHVFENTVAVELLRRKSFNPNLGIFYWKNTSHEEVDFIVKDGLIITQLIQVCYDIEDYDTKKREVRSLLKACKDLKCNNLVVINESYENEEEFNGNKIKFIPLWKWLLFNKL